MCEFGTRQSITSIGAGPLAGAARGFSRFAIIRLRSLHVYPR
jgi:hypothetical protein